MTSNRVAQPTVVKTIQADGYVTAHRLFGLSWRKQPLDAARQGAALHGAGRSCLESARLLTQAGAFLLRILAHGRWPAS